LELVGHPRIQDRKFSDVTTIPFSSPTIGKVDGRGWGQPCLVRLEQPENSRKRATRPIGSARPSINATMKRSMLSLASSDQRRKGYGDTWCYYTYLAESS
jgi:hypothetical protein